MLRLLSTIQKEFLILVRDRGGLAIMFLMPTVLITVMALIQDAPFRDYQELKIPLLIMNKDTGSLGRSLENGLIKSKLFEISRSKNNEEAFKKDIAAGKYDIGIVIPFGASENFDARIDDFVSKAITGSDSVQSKEPVNKRDVLVYFAPDIKKSFKNSVLSSLKQFSSKLVSQKLYENFSAELNGESPDGTLQEMGDFVVFNEESPVADRKMKFELNSVQHNVPAWTIFGMFFIVISLSASIIKERQDGSYLRILTMPGSYTTVMAGKIATYLLVCLIQCLLMLLVGIFLLPHLGLPRLEIGSNLLPVAVVAICSGLAATGFGILAGSIFTTHQQASTFGAVTVVILAALGGIWIPVYVMPGTIRAIAEFSPLFWGLSAFHEVFLLSGTLEVIWPYALKLLLFFAACTGVSFYYNKSKNH